MPAPTATKARKPGPSASAKPPAANTRGATKPRGVASKPSATTEQPAPAPSPEPSAAEQKKAQRELEKRANAWARKIKAANDKAVAGIIEIAQILAQAKDELIKGTWKAWVEGNLKWTVRTADRFVDIGKYQPFQSKDVQKSLPASWGTLDVLTKLTPEQFNHALAEGFITPAMWRSDAADLVKAFNPKPENDSPEPAVEPENNEGEGVEDATTVQAAAGGSALVRATNRLRELVDNEIKALLEDRALQGDEADQQADRLYKLIEIIEGFLGSTDTSTAGLPDQRPPSPARRSIRGRAGDTGEREA